MCNTEQIVDYPTKDRLKKKQQIAFRRFMRGESPSVEIRNHVTLNFLETKDWLKQWMLEGMNWNNYGDVWVIDHIVPLRLFDLTKEEDLKIVWNYKNLMPLFKKDNLHKEGDLRFSLLVLQERPECHITNTLKDILIREVDKMNKYLKCPNA